jgi:hypothetical protein
MKPVRTGSAPGGRTRRTVPLLIAGIAVVALGVGWLAFGGHDAPDPARAKPAVDAGARPTAAAVGIPGRVATAPVAGPQPGAAQDVRPPDVATQPFPQLHTKTRRTDKTADKRHAKRELYESEQEELFDTAQPTEIPFEGDFPLKGTFSFWLNPVWDSTSQDDASFVTVADGKLRIVKNVTFLRFETVDASGNGDGVGFRISDWQPGEWHFITATWDAGVIALWVDGTMVGQKYIAALDIPADSSVFVGSQFPPGRPIAPGMMSGFRFRGRALNQGTIGREFETTAPPPLGEDGK